MKRMFLVIISLAVTILSCSACGRNSSANGAKYGTYKEIGDTFVFQDDAIFTGSLRYTVSGARLVSTQENCPPYEWFQKEGVLCTPSGTYLYEDWFTEGGAFDQGCRILMLDVTVENVDARNRSRKEGGIYDNPYAFHCNWFFNMVDLALLRDEGEKYPLYQPYSMMGFNECCQYGSEDHGYPEDYYDPFVFGLAQGATAEFTLCYPINVNDDGTQKDVSMLALEVNNFQTKLEDKICIRLNLEEGI